MIGEKLPNHEFVEGEDCGRIETWSQRIIHADNFVLSVGLFSDGVFVMIEFLAADGSVFAHAQMSPAYARDAGRTMIDHAAKAEAIASPPQTRRQ